jgi:uncharacterized protein (TIGR04168 family)
VHVRVLGDPHGLLDLEEDAFWLSQTDLALCTGDFAYHIQGRGRDRSRQVMAALRKIGVVTILGNHDGICHHKSFTYRFGEAEPALQEEMIQALGECYLGYRRLDFEEFSLVGARPFSNGNPGIQWPPYEHEKISVEKSAELVLDLIRQAPRDKILILAHNGPKGLGGKRDSPYGRDWKVPACDWGDEDLALVLEDLPTNKQVMGLVTGHMHHQLRGGGYRQRVAFVKDIPVINAAVVPRVMKKGILATRVDHGEKEARWVEKKVFQEHRHFLDLEIDLQAGKIVSAFDFWARKGSRTGEGISFELLKV